MRTLFVYLFLFSLAFPIKAQSGRGDLRKGNRQFKNEKYEEAEVAYRKAMVEKGMNNVAEFNLGDALYRQKKFEEAGRQFEAAASGDAVKANSAKAYHNFGNSLLQSGKIEESINAYKESLRKNPTDLDTKYNLSFAQMMKKKQDQQKQQQNDKNDKKDKNDKNGDSKDQQKKQDQQDQQNKQNPQDQKDQKADQQQSKPQNARISKEDAKRLLEALATDEKKVQEKVKKEKANANKVRSLKDW